MCYLKSKYYLISLNIHGTFPCNEFSPNDYVVTSDVRTTRPFYQITSTASNMIRFVSTSILICFPLATKSIHSLQQTIKQSKQL